MSLKIKQNIQQLFEIGIANKIIEDYQLVANNIRVLSRKYNLSRYIIHNILLQVNIKLKTCKEAKCEQFNEIKIEKNKNLKKLFESDIAKKIIEDYQLIFNNTRVLAKKYKIKRNVIVKILKYANVKLKKGSEVTRDRLKNLKIENNKKLFESDIGRNIIKEYTLPGVSIASLSKKHKLHRRKIERLFKLANIKLKTLKEVIQEQTKLGKFSGENNPMYGKNSPIGSSRCKWYRYNEKIYQGKYEFRFGIWLEYQQIKFICHDNIKKFKYKLNDKCRVYNPDFYIIDDNVFIEIKGYFTSESKKKMQIVKDLYPNEIIKIYNKSILKNLGVLNIDKILGIKLELYEIKK